MKKTIYTFLLILPLLLYWGYVGNFNFSLSDHGEDWAYFATFFGGIYGPIFSLIALCFLIEQVKTANHTNKTSSETLKNTQETTNFNFITFEIKTLIKRIDNLNLIEVNTTPEQWITTFHLIILDISSLNNSYKKSLEHEIARNTIQTVLSQSVKWFLRENISKYHSNKSLFYTEQMLEVKNKNLWQIEELLEEISNSILISVPDTKPDYF